MTTTSPSPDIPSSTCPGYDLTRTLNGYGITTETTMGEDLDALYVDLCRVFSDARPHALIIKRLMAAGIAGAEGDEHSHDALKAGVAITTYSSAAATMLRLH